MSRQDSNNHTKDAAVLQSMTLLATLSTAAEVHAAVSERRAGRDPSAQEPHQVTVPYLHKAAGELQGLLMQLLLSHVNIRHDPEADLALVVRHFDERMKLWQVTRLLQGMHQRLLSLYPDVSEELVEEARIVHRQAEALFDSDVDDFVEVLSDFLERGLGLATWTEHELPA